MDDGLIDSGSLYSHKLLVISNQSCKFLKYIVASLLTLTTLKVLH